MPFWNKITKEQKDCLLLHTKEEIYQKGQSMHAGGSDCSGLFLLKKGQVRVYIISETGKEITLYHLFERDLCIFSASCMMKNINFDVFVEAEKETGVYLIPTQYYNQVLKESLPLTEYTNELLASRFSDVMWIMEQVLFQSFDKRLADFLLEQSIMEGTNTFEMTHEQIARHMGSAREVVSRMLKYFAEENMIALARGKITILNREKLEKVTSPL
ncbi:MAG: Crp/Fnr family transcriptional regulator [Acetivibrio sp.]